PNRLRPCPRNPAGRRFPARSPRSSLCLAAMLGALLVPTLSLAAPKAPTSFCTAGTDCAPASDAPGKEGMKWNPGHYMQVRLGDSAEGKQADRFSWYDEIAGNTAIEGVVLRLSWGQLEASKGN